MNVALRSCEHCGGAIPNPSAKRFCSYSCRGKVLGKLQPSMHPPFRERWERSFIKRGDDECWPWTGTTTPAGYGQISVSGRKRTMATRVSWEIHHGTTWPAGLLALHSCDNPGCVNPRHIRPGTQRENIHDCLERGRHPASNADRCKNGHIYTAETTYLGYGYRSCRICMNARSRRAYASRK